MADFKNMTVQALRDLARKALGRGYTKKTKAELVEALQSAERAVASVAERAATSVKNATGRAARATEKVVESVRRGRERRAVAKGQRKEAADEKRAAKRTAKAAKAAKAAGAKTSARPGRRAPAEAEAPRRKTADARGAPEPDPEGYMVARVAGEDALRGAPHAMTESAVEEKRPARGRNGRPRGAPAAHVFEEHLGELPWSYADDALTLLARDPTTLFLYWDHSAETLRQAFEGLDGGRPQIWIYTREPEGGWTRIRTVDFALESRSYYVHELEPGRLYRAEIHLVDRRGREKLVPRISNEMMLPPVGPSPVIDDRFLRILWAESLRERVGETHPGGPFSDEIRAQLARLSDWSRFAGRVWGGSAGGIGGRPFSATSSSSARSPDAPPSGRNDDDGEGR
jgi:hypothetical protein